MVSAMVFFEEEKDFPTCITLVFVPFAPFFFSLSIIATIYILFIFKCIFFFESDSLYHGPNNFHYRCHHHHHHHHQDLGVIISS